MKTVHSLDKIQWHLENNVIPKLSDTAISGIIETLDRLNKGEISIIHQISQNAGVTVGEMCEDLKIELE